MYKERWQKKTGKMWEFWKNRGGGLPESHFHFLLFLTWETPPKKVLKCKINHILLKKNVIPKQGGGGGPPLGENSHIFPFFFWERPLINWLPSKSRNDQKFLFDFYVFFLFCNLHDNCHHHHHWALGRGYAGSNKVSVWFIPPPPH